jgi:hypothetical protein
VVRILLVRRENVVRDNVDSESSEPNAKPGEGRPYHGGTGKDGVPAPSVALRPGVTEYGGWCGHDE